MSSFVRTLLIVGWAYGAGATAAAADRPLEPGDSVMPTEACEIRSGDKVVPLKGRILPFVVQSITGDQADVGVGRAPLTSLVRLSESEAYYAEWIKRQPRSVDAYHLRSIARMERKDYAGTIADLDAAIALIPNVARLYTKRAAAYELYRDPETMKLRFPERIREDCKRAIELNRHEVWAYCIRFSLDAELNPERFLSSSQDLGRIDFMPPQDAGSCLVRAMHFRTLDAPVQAIRDFDKLLDLEPYCAKAYAYRGDALRLQGKKADALRDFEMAIRVAPKDIDGYLARWRFYLSEDEPKLALADAEKAWSLAPDDIDVLTGFAAMLCNCKDPAYRNRFRAMKFAADAYRIDPSNWRTLSRMGLVYASLGEFDIAKEFLAKALRRKDQMPKYQAAQLEIYLSRVGAGHDDPERD